jgi:D-sedoheptulose 7-phosphate isomerase
MANNICPFCGAKDKNIPVYLETYDIFILACEDCRDKLFHNKSSNNLEDGELSAIEQEQFSYVAHIVDALDHYVTLPINKAVSTILKYSKNRIYIAGNGGSAALAEHFVIDLMKMGNIHNVSSLTSNVSVLTAMANDISYPMALSAQIPDEKCLLIAISSSGESENIIFAANKVHNVGGEVIGITRSTPNSLSQRSDILIPIESDNTQIIEDISGIILHIIARCVKVATRG